MAVHAAHSVRVVCGAVDHVLGHVAVAGKTVLLHDLRVLLLRRDRLVEVLQGEALGVVVAVLALAMYFR